MDVSQRRKQYRLTADSRWIKWTNHRKESMSPCCEPLVDEWTNHGEESTHVADSLSQMVIVARLVIRYESTNWSILKDMSLLPEDIFFSFREKTSCWADVMQEDRIARSSGFQASSNVTRCGTGHPQWRFRVRHSSQEPSVCLWPVSIIKYLFFFFKFLVNIIAIWAHQMMKFKFDKLTVKYTQNRL